MNAGRYTIYSLLGAAMGFTALASLLAAGSLDSPPWLLTIGVGSFTLMAGLFICGLACAAGAVWIGYKRFKEAR